MYIAIKSNWQLQRRRRIQFRNTQEHCNEKKKRNSSLKKWLNINVGTSVKKVEFPRGEDTPRFCWKMCTISHAVYCLLWFWHFLHASSGRLRCEWPTCEHTHTPTQRHTHTPRKHLKTWFSSVHGLTPSPVYAIQSVSQPVCQSGNLCLAQSRCWKRRVCLQSEKAKSRKKAMLRQCCISVCSTPSLLSSSLSSSLWPSSSLVIDVWHCSNHKNLPTVCCLLMTAKCPVDYCQRPFAPHLPSWLLANFYVCACLYICVCVRRHSTELIYLWNVSNGLIALLQQKQSRCLFCGRYEVLELTTSNLITQRNFSFLDFCLSDY